MRAVRLFPVILLLATVSAMAQVDIDGADRMFFSGADPLKCRDRLEDMLPQAADSHERSEILWRMAKISVYAGEAETDRERKREIFAEGVAFADRAIRENPKSPDSYMWHAGNIGREGQMHSIMEQIRSLPVIMKDVTTILDDLHRTDFLEAWQTMAEIYSNHPFKSNDGAICFERKAVLCISDGRLHISTYTLLARLLYERGWDSARRSSAIEKNRQKFAESYSSVTDRYAYFDGSLGTDFRHAWSSKPIGAMSDREEALAIVAYVRKIYDAAASRTHYDDVEYKELLALSRNWK